MKNRKGKDYRLGDLIAALFEEANKILSHQGKGDGPCDVFIERCQTFKVNPPESEWDGSWEMDSK